MQPPLSNRNQTMVVSSQTPSERTKDRSLQNISANFLGGTKMTTQKQQSERNVQAKRGSRHEDQRNSGALINQNDIVYS